MTMDLKVLADHRDDLLLAEVAAWLHDDFKHTDAHIHRYVQGAPQPSGRQDAVDLIPSVQISPLGRSIPFSEVKNRRRSDFVNGYLNRCHYTAHIEKQDGDGPQRYPAYISSPFGYEAKTVPTDLTSDLRNKISWSNLAKRPFNGERNNFREQISSLFWRVGGDTRRPTNEITLWEWGHTVGALYKSALAGALLGYQPSTPNDLRWRLLSIRFDGLSFFTQSHRIPDLLARHELLNEALDHIRDMLEVEYPLGTEVYRDENGSIFVVPGCKKGQCTLDLLALTDAHQKSLRTLILERVQAIVEGELVPTILIDSDPWWGQDPRRQGNDEIPPVPDHLRPITNTTDAGWVWQQWDGRQEEICTVCGLRPQGPSTKAKDRNICDVCEGRRADRAKEWAKKLDTTIWTDEVADINGRLALVVGQFTLDHWLDGTLVQTLTVTDPAQDSTPDKREVVKKTPSFARLRRIWETTRTFWQEALPTDPGRNLADSLVAKKVGESGPRLEIIPENRDSLNLGLFHTYELVINGIRLSVVWDSTHQRFITCDNLDYLAKPEQLGRPVKDVLQPGARLTLEEPVGYGAQNQVWGTITIQNVQELPDRYTPAIPILAEPRTFMALVPADKALEVVRAIQEKYEREMGKVRNRLPLTLGVVYFGRRTPLAAALDAGRRMIHQPVRTVRAEVKKLDPPVVTDTTWPVAREVTLRIGEREITLTVPTVMGDGQTQDVWYPYWQVTGQPTGRTRWFVGPNGEHWVHVCDLQQGDQVYFTPSTFDFEFLDTTTRRFEVIYDANGQRRSPEKRQRPYLLEELDGLEKAWGEISRLSKSQIHAIIPAIETKRQVWEKPVGEEALALPEGDVFRQFVCDTLREAKVHSELLEHAALSGILRDATEIHLEIMKEEVR